MVSEKEEGDGGGTAFVAGTEGKNDILVRITPGKKGEGLVFKITGKGKELFQEEIEESARKVLGELGISDAVVEMVDNWALDFTVRARVRAAALKFLGREG